LQPPSVETRSRGGRAEDNDEDEDDEEDEEEDPASSSSPTRLPANSPKLYSPSTVCTVQWLPPHCAARTDPIGSSTLAGSLLLLLQHKTRLLLCLNFLSCHPCLSRASLGKLQLIGF
jgi:hypothetical protein